MSSPTLTRTVGALLLALLATPAAGGAIRKCRAPGGEVLFSTDPCRAGWALHEEHPIRGSEEAEAPGPPEDATAALGQAPAAPRIVAIFGE